MKRVVGILAILLLSMLLGISVGWARGEAVSLVSTYPSTVIGD